MLIRHLRQIHGFDRATGSVSFFGELGNPAEPQRVAAAPERFAPYTDIVRIRDASTGGWSLFLADVVGAPGGDEYISTKDAAKLLGVEDRTVRRWAESGRLEAVRTAGGAKRPGSWKVSLSSVRSQVADPRELDPGPAPALKVRRKRAPKIVETPDGQFHW
jgi:excisionase family DNA binding protein